MTFLIAEAASAWWNGPSESDGQRLDRAFALVDAAAAAGADAVKFQLFRADELYAKDTDHWRAVKPLEMPLAWLRLLQQHAERAGIEFMCSAFSPQMVDAVDPLVRRHKIASLEMTDHALLRHVASKRKPVLLSTGVATVEQVHAAVDVLRGVPLTLLHCVTAYPAPPEDLNLQAMMTVALTSSGWLPYGLSDHTLDPVTCPVMAVAIGASVIEKHLTLDRAMQGPDHVYALTPLEWAEMARCVRLAERMLGEPVKKPRPSEAAWLPFQHRDGGLRGGVV